MALLRFRKTSEHTHKIKIGKSPKRVDSDCCFFGVLDFTQLKRVELFLLWKALFHRKFLSSFLLILTQI